MYFLLIILSIFLLQKDVVSFHWDSNTPQSNAVILGFIGGNKTFLFGYQLEPTDKVTYSKWSFKSAENPIKKRIIAYKQTDFVPANNYAGRLEHGGNGVITLTNLTDKDSGRYIIRVFIEGKDKLSKTFVKKFNLKVKEGLKSSVKRRRSETPVTASVNETVVNGSSAPVNKTGVNGSSTPVNKTVVNGSSAPVNKTGVNGSSTPVNKTVVNGSSAAVRVILECPVGKFGLKCDKMCSVGCKSGRCHKDSGECTLGCKPGYIVDTPALCNKPCAENYYGESCKHGCNVGCVTSTCNKVTGLCSSCKKGWTGDMCQNGYTRYGNLWLNVMREGKNFFNAQKYCQARGGHLAYAKSNHDLKFVYMAIVSKTTPPAGRALDASYWVGADDLLKENTFTWGDNSNLNRALFANSKLPTNGMWCPLRAVKVMYKDKERYVNYGQNCLTMYYLQYGFNDDCCLKELYFVCQYGG